MMIDVHTRPERSCLDPNRAIDGCDWAVCGWRFGSHNHDLVYI